MDDSLQTRCFTCGQPTGNPPALNRLADGSACPGCLDRLLMSVPAPFAAEPREPQGPAEELEESWWGGQLAPADDDDSGPRPA